MTTSTTRREVTEPGDLEPGTLNRLFLDAVTELEGEEAFRHKDANGWTSITYSEFAANVRRLARAMDVLGVARGDRVAILSENRPEWPLADYASLGLCAFNVPVYPTLPADQIHYLLEDSGAKLIVVSSAEQAEKIRSIRGRLPALHWMITFDDVAAGERELSLSEALERGDAAAFEPEWFEARSREARPDDIATVIYTSGTTGRPKGVMLTHDNIYSNTRAVDLVVPTGTEDVALSLLPLSHIFERMVEYFLFSKGVTIAYAESIEKVPENLKEVRPTIVPSVPRLYEKIYARVKGATGVKGVLVKWASAVGTRWADAKLAGREPSALVALQHRLADKLVFSKLRQATGGQLRFFISGGAPLSEALGRFFYAAGVLILEGYGLTETSPVTNVNRPDRFRFGTVGPALPGTSIRIADDGEILVKGPQVMKGYYKNEQATAEVIVDGWFHTGDVGEIDADGFLRVTDRKKDLIVTSGGKNIAPQPIENRLKLNGFVAEAVMIGDRRPHPIVLVVPNRERLTAWAAQNGITGTDLSELIENDRVQSLYRAEIESQLAGVANYELPKKIGLLSREFSIDGGELTPKLSVKRRVVEKRYADLIESMYASDREDVVHVAHDDSRD
ncbi:MAG TPA: long-chain fatty acid--CoA ligase [Longimicrobiales bacterium]|nr:long-chain fatty acid--CoA ligase [Longimicrobiales bacterium]